MWMQDCCDCSSAKSEGMEVWMQHLATCHTLPTEWPSDRADKLTGQNALRPYTTVTESKKKRRKDSVPRPLNSFMLFAQYIRRNVLRVYNDASNSVISQQLGDLWRTVPQEYRNQYDDEANRLVRIHQREFPNYKYQPKKRLSPNLSMVNGGGNGAGKSGHHALVSVTTADAFRTVANKGDNCRSLGRPSVFQSYQSTNGSAFQRGTDAARSRLIPSVSSTQILSENNGKSLNEYIRNVNGKMNIKSSESVHCVISSTKSKPLTVNPTPFRSNTTSLSSALPPLHAPLYRPFAANSEKHHQGSCDSAYASGINSSSSSSASSPSVGDILSPTKLGHSTGIDGGKTTSANQRIQFVSIRPQSQKIPVTNSLPTRQRFLSTTNRTDDPMLNGNSVADEVLVLTANSGQNSAISGHSFHQLTTPVYVRLSSDTNGSTNNVLLALPAGTTIIQPLGHIPAATTHIPILQQNQQSNEQYIVASKASLINLSKDATQSSKNINPSIIPLYLASMMTCEEPSEGSSNSSSPSSWSPLSGDVFLPIQHITNPGDDQELKCKVESIAQTYSIDPIVEPVVFLHDADDPLYGSECNLINKMDIEQVTIKSHARDKVYSEFGVDESDIHNDTLDAWSFSVEAQSECSKKNMQDCILPTPTSASSTTSVTSLVPTTADMFPQNSDIVHQDIESTGSDFPITNEDNFDSSFDAMMNSIDITSFLPGTFNGNEDTVMDYTIDNDLCEPEICPDNSTRHLDIMEEPPCTSSSSNVGNSYLYTNSLRELQYSSVIDIEDMLTNLDHTAVLVNGGVSCVEPNTHSSYADRRNMIVSKIANNVQRGANGFSVVSGSLIGGQINTSNNRGCYDHLSDLDSLDKSSLLLLKPDWSLRVRD